MYSWVVTIPSPPVPKPTKSKIGTLFARLWMRYKNLSPLDKLLATVLTLGTLGFFANRIWTAFTSGGYVLPNDSEDWAAWGTWIGGLATAAAFMYTAFQLRDQRAYRAQDDASALASLREKAKLVSAALTATTQQQFLVGHQIQGEEKNIVVKGAIQVLEITNDSENPISNVVIIFTRPFLLPPLGTLARPVQTDADGQSWVYPTSFDVPPISQNFQLAQSSLGDNQGVHCEIVASGVPQECDLAFAEDQHAPRIQSVKFTDSSGTSWMRDLTNDVLTHLP